VRIYNVVIPNEVRDLGVTMRWSTPGFLAALGMTVSREACSQSTFFVAENQR
jgi:hypothetical protein